LLRFSLFAAKNLTSPVVSAVAAAAFIIVKANVPEGLHPLLDQAFFIAREMLIALHDKTSPPYMDNSAL